MVEPPLPPPDECAPDSPDGDKSCPAHSNAHAKDGSQLDHEYIIDKPNYFLGNNTINKSNIGERGKEGDRSDEFKRNP